MKTFADCIYEEGYREGLRLARMERRKELIRSILSQLHAYKVPEETIREILTKGLKATKKEIKEYMATEAEQAGKEVDKPSVS